MRHIAAPWTKSSRGLHPSGEMVDKHPKSSKSEVPNEVGEQQSKSFGLAPSGKPHEIGARPAPLGIQRARTAGERLTEKAQAKSRAYAWISKFAGCKKVRTVAPHGLRSAADTLYSCANRGHMGIACCTLAQPRILPTLNFPLAERSTASEVDRGHVDWGGGSISRHHLRPQR